MKEEEALAKLCPYMKAHCIASHCMMWRDIDQSDGYCGLAGVPHNQNHTPTSPLKIKPYIRHT